MISGYGGSFIGYFVGIVVLGFSLLFFVCGLVLGTGGWLVCVDGIVWV